MPTPPISTTRPHRQRRRAHRAGARAGWKQIEHHVDRASGLVLLRHARVVLDEIAAAQRELDGAAVHADEIRLGAFVSAGAVVLPRALAVLRDQRPDTRVTTR